MGKIKDLAGQRFGRLVVKYDTGKRQNRQVIWHCVCDCGNEVEILGGNLRKGYTQSCGCLSKERAKENIKIAIPKAIQSIKKYEDPNEIYTRLYRIWAGMKRRCNNTKAINYSDYGGKGVYVCKEWEEYSNFKKWALTSGYNDDLTLDRIDTTKEYSPKNCRWATMKEQQNNRTNNHLLTLKGKTQTVAQWAEELNINYKVLEARIIRGWDIERALFAPIRSKKDGSADLISERYGSEEEE